MDTNRREFAKKLALGGAGMSLLAGCLTDDGEGNGNGNGNGGNGNGNGGNGNGNGGNGNGNGGDDFPDETITLVVPGSAGGGTDTYSRELGPALGDALGVPVQIDNRPGGNQLIGPGHVANQEADGYTIAVVNLPAVPAGWLIEEPDFDLRSFEGLGGFAGEGAVMVVNNDYADWEPEEVLEAYRTGEFSNIGVVHLGSFHMMGAVLESEDYFDVSFEWVGYPDAAEHNRAVASGEIPAAFSSEAGASQLVNEGEVTPMFTTNETDLYDVPTIEDMGYPPADFISQSRGFTVLEDVPDNRKDILADGMEEAVTSDSVQDWAESTGQNVFYTPREEFDENFHRIIDELPDLIDLDQFSG
ncbi:Bug family tripartite tricarboxylate transporter substrate binding protein [Natronosalvus caseinilyticus]|uniref:Bug family tripartite tricarboxylate transporter substrate binding protein n=1 Tax=Natronosalvus caseinilyticus TaxID=2953747 RepID=UPI0028A9B26B|nr:tripartite tricarboxylate transporter substrate binding protein [Natronosalvus caseinilyticus]